MNKPPNFWEVFGDALRLSATKRGFLAYCPWWLIACCAIPTLLVYFSGSMVRPRISDSDAMTIFSAVAVVGGFFGSVSIATMGQVQRMVSEYPFSAYLKEEKLFDQFLFWPQFTLLLQVGLILFSICIALLTRLVDLQEFTKYLIAVNVGMLVYVCTKTWNLIDLVRRLSWHFEDYNRLLAEERSRSQ
jgi:FtsH-binding integral membrane protein